MAMASWSLFLWGILSALSANSSEQPSGSGRVGVPDTHEAHAKKKTATKKGLQRWFHDEECWFDLERKIVVIGGEISQREGVLEMFACPLGTKEHESIVAVHCRSATAHTYLLAVGAQPGSPVTYQPEYSPARGPQIDIDVLWTDESGIRQKRTAQELVRHVKTGREMEHNWVFAGSQFVKDEDGKECYLADWGEFICVSNFGSATLDLPVESTQANSELLFAPFTERIPPRGTKVRLVLRPVPVKKEPPPNSPSKKAAGSATQLTR